jgi:hypothetical protein
MVLYGLIENVIGVVIVYYEKYFPFALNLDSNNLLYAIL